MSGRTIRLGSRRPGPSATPRPQLTSLVDMMVILVVFLLESFAVEGQFTTSAPDLQLPESAATRPVPAALALAVTTGGIALEGVRVAAVPTDLDGLEIAPLLAALRALAPAGADPAHGQALTIQCDKRVDFAVLKRVLYTCNAAGCDQLSLLVVRERS